MWDVLCCHHLSLCHCHWYSFFCFVFVVFLSSASSQMQSLVLLLVRPVFHCNLQQHYVWATLNIKQNGTKGKQIVSASCGLWWCKCVWVMTFIIIIIIIITFKGAIRDFVRSPHSATNCLQHVRSSSPGAVMCKSHATHWVLIMCKCHVTCHLVWRDSSAVKFDRVEIAFIWSLFCWLNH